jgi:hypothetical protein
MLSSFDHPTGAVSKEVFYDTQYHPVPPVEKDSYVIKKDLYVDLTVDINSVPPVF